MFLTLIRTYSVFSVVCFRSLPSMIGTDIHWIDKTVDTQFLKATVFLLTLLFIFYIGKLN